jgi:peptidoglycan/xylan/chitin deacetylase (PgdA/CDA1 family)
MWKRVFPGLLLLALACPASAQRLALTCDDGFDTAAQPDAAQLNAALLEALAKNEVKAVFFASGARIDSDDGLKLAQAWVDAGHGVANHTYSHRSLNSSAIELDAYLADIRRNEVVLDRLTHWERRFRFPYLKEGDTAAKRDGARDWLRDYGYASGAVSIDTSDWYYDQRLRAWMAKNPGQSPALFRQPYLDHLRDRATYYSNLSKQVLGRDIDHVILLHTNTINAMFIGDAIAMFRAAGWEIITPAEAYADAVYAQPPDVLPAGESLVWSLAKKAGVQELRYPAEDGEYEKDRIDAVVGL